MRTREKHSIDWDAVRNSYRQNTMSVRSLGRTFDVSDTAIRKRARKENWVRAAPPLGLREPNGSRSFGARLDALAVALAATAGGDDEHALASDRRFVAAMVALRAPPSNIAAVLEIDETRLSAEFAAELTESRAHELRD